jgi:CheY-like chemotaxis protein
VRIATVLLAEDDPNDAFLVQRAFKKAELPHKLLHLIDGQEVVDYLSRTTLFLRSPGVPVPDLLLLDLKMPRLDGFEVLEWLQRRSEFKTMPAVVLSSSDHFSDIKRAIALDAADYFRKPSDPAELFGLAIALHERWLRSEPPCAGAVIPEAGSTSSVFSTEAARFRLAATPDGETSGD